MRDVPRRELAAAQRVLVQTRRLILGASDRGAFIAFVVTVVLANSWSAFIGFAQATPTRPFWRQETTADAVRNVRQGCEISRNRCPGGTGLESV